ncbi:MotE family protein [Rossellomorea aquimaris]|uniref:MotE family protein n=1 Tax=Rossellomorea TaxID=2837508 RepID=UPI001CD29075|nr:MotE family protein [Rossellomorea aquimaris]MCA1059165.1 MotE family protein [Rossellomorea aquimaris]
MAKVIEEEKKDSSNRFQRFIFIIVIPLLFAITFALVIMTFAGINIFEKAQSISSDIPFLSKVIPSNETEDRKQLQERIISLNASIEDQEAKTAQLQSEIEKRDSENEQLQATIQQQKAELEELRQIGEDNKRAFKEVVSTFEAMSAKSAAPVLMNMDDEEAMKILSNIKPDTLADILEKMPPEDAARYTGLLSTEE